jgi:hypothetical protein
MSSFGRFQLVKGIDMPRIRLLAVRLSLSAALVLSSAVAAGWKWGRAGF